MSLTHGGEGAPPAAAAPPAVLGFIANQSAGAASACDAEAVAGRVQSVFPGSQLQVEIAQPKQLDAALERVFAAAKDGVVVFGGDGTARAAARRAMDRGTPIAVLPGGTMNVLAKLVFGHDDLDKTIDTLPHCEPTALDVGFVGEEPFFLSAAFGFAGPMARFREEMRPPRQWRRIGAASLSLARGLGPSLRGGVKWRPQGQGEWRRAHTLVTAVGSIDRVISPEDQPMDARARMQAVGVRIRSGWDLARLGGDVLADDWRESEQVAMAGARCFDLDLRTRRPLVVLDGEPMRLSNVAEVYVRPRQLPVLAPL